MKIAVIATTEGAGSTFISTNLSYVSSYTYVDANLPFFGSTLFECEKISETPALWHTEELINDTCQDCTSCKDLCKKKAFFQTEERKFLNCKGCPDGDCTVACHNKNTNSKTQEIGTIVTQKSGKLKLVHLNGESASVPLIFECALKELSEEKIIVDCPPYSSANALPILKLCDFCVIVVEPGIYDFENFKALIRLCKLANKPYGVIINKLTTPYDKLTDYCNLHSTPVLAKIPMGARESKMIANGQIISAVKYTYKQYFSDVLVQIKKKLK